MGYARTNRLRDVMADPAARRVLNAHLDGLVDELPIFSVITFAPVGALGILPALAERVEEAGDALWDELAALPGQAPSERRGPAWQLPREDYEPDEVPGGSAGVHAPAVSTRWSVVEVCLDGPSHGNPFTEVELEAAFRHDEHGEVRVGGFYDGHGVYRIRFMPKEEGTWRFETWSNARSLRGVQGEVQVGPAAPTQHGPVGVSDQFHFAHADGARCVPVGTTAYAWTSQPEELQERTLVTLASSPFNKLRMCVFPKHYLFNSNEPTRFPFEQTAEGDWDYTRFDVGFFRHLEQRIAELGEQGIQADLILFHPYDRWGFADMPASVDDHYLRYVVRRLAAYSNVWWSMANEYDLMPWKSGQDWERLAEVVRSNDPVGHLQSIHNCLAFYDHTKPWVTHVSAQRIDAYRTAECTDEWRATYGKPVVLDECGYEGDIDQGWGNLSGHELVRRAWEAAVRGGYLGHGETYLNDREELWWSKGGELVGSSPERLDFLARIVEEAPGGRLDPLPSEWDLPCGGSDTYRVSYLGRTQPKYRDVVLPRGRWAVDVIDTWAMTVDHLDGVFERVCRVALPGREYMAIRLRAVP